MDMSRAFTSSREVIEERRAVCAALKDFDAPQVPAYDNEIYEITNQIVIADGLRLVDSSRIHVDVEAMRLIALSQVALNMVSCPG